MKRTMMAILAMAAVVALSTTAQAAVLTIALYEAGGNVVGTVGGTLNTKSLLPHSINYTDSGLTCPVAGTVAVGPQQALWYWTGLTGGASNCGLGSFVRADAGTGDTVGVNLNQRSVYAPKTYVSGSELSGTSTWNNTSFENLGITPGTYTMTYNDREDSIVLQVGSVPEPATMAVLAAGGLFALARRRRRA